MRSWTTEFHNFPTIDSTNTWCKQHAFPKNNNHVILAKADEQTAGKGQHGRTWVSPAGCNLYLSYCFLLPDLEQVIHIPQILSLSLLQILEGYDLESRIKWPNDLIIDGKKIAGVLCEVEDHRVIVGIGVNINMSQSLIDEVPQAATSMRLLLGHDLSIDEVMHLLTERFLENLSLLLTKGFSLFYKDYLDSLLYVGQMVRWSYGEEEKTGRLKGIDPKGRIILFLEDTETEILIQSGQIRPIINYSD